MNIAGEKIRDLLSPVCAALDAHAFLRVSVEDGSDAAVAEPLCSMLAVADFAHGPYPPLYPPADLRLPMTVDDIAAKLKIVALSEDRVLSLLVNMCTRDLTYQSAWGPWAPETARSILAQVLDALGPQIRWWSNNDFSFAQNWDANGDPDCYSSDGLTGYVFDRALIGSGAGVLVTFLAFADD